MAERPSRKTVVNNNWLRIRSRHDLVVMEGWLAMRGEHLHTLNRCYFVIFEDGQMFGFRRQPNPDHHHDPCHSYNLLGAAVKFEGDYEDLFILFNITMRKLNSDVCWVSTSRTFFFRTFEERDNWANAIKFVNK